VKKIHTTHFWVCMLGTLGAFIDCKNRYNFQMGASTLYKRRRRTPGPEREPGMNEVSFRARLHLIHLKPSPMPCHLTQFDSKCVIRDHLKSFVRVTIDITRIDIIS
jgi:hypothetical protein